jgi:membrane protein
VRKVTDYTTLMVVGPLLIIAAIAISTAAQSSSVVTFLHRSLLLGGIVDFMLRLTSLVLGCTALVALYVIMPNARVRFASALFGGVVAGLLWQAALLLHVRFQMGVANYNALYSGFAALPIFLVWLYLSWNIVLLGAQLAASHQYEKRIKQRVRARHMDQELRETLAVVAATVVARRFLEGRPPATSSELAATLDLPLPAIEPVLEALVRARVLVRVVQHGDLGYDPGRDLDTVRMVDVENAVRYDPEAEPLKETLEHTIGPELSELLNARRELGVADTGSLTLRQLAAQCDLQVEAISVEQPAAAPAPGLLDGKQPSMPA